mmetsp:Transcript_9380/g.23027  ORF Transcript_9380/g.23027 Transcript_9380/m.23027 type:complete len:213 (-) Transcript_9380:789-1427(-)
MRLPSDEVVRNPPARLDRRRSLHDFSVFALVGGCRVKLQQRVFQVLVNLHHPGTVTASPAVVRRGEDGDHVSFVRPLVALHDQLVRAADEFEPVRLVEALGDILAENVPSAPWRNAPPHHIVRVGPQHVAHRPLMRHLGHAIQLADVVQRVDTWRESCVWAEDLVFNYRRQRQRVEGLREAFPNFWRAVHPHALVEEAVHLGDLSALVVPPQ